MADLLEHLRHLRLELRQQEMDGGRDVADPVDLRASCRSSNGPLRPVNVSWSAPVGWRRRRPAARSRAPFARRPGPGRPGRLFTVEADLHALVIGPGPARLVGLGPLAPILDRVRRTRADLDVLALSSTSAVMRPVVLSLAPLDPGRLAADLWPPVRALSGDGPARTRPDRAAGHVAVGPAARPARAAPRRRRSAGEWLRADRARPTRAIPDAATVFATGPRVSRADEEVQSCAPAMALVNGSAICARPSNSSTRRRVPDWFTSRHTAYTMPDNPLVLLAGAWPDGLVFGHKPDPDAPTARRMSLLSACDLGLATVRPGGESLGMTAALLHTGTSSVVAGVARVADDVRLRCGCRLSPPAQRW